MMILKQSEQYPPRVGSREPNCEDCGMDIKEGRELYHVNDSLWMSHGNDEGLLCVGCLEDRLGRGLRPQDFSVAPINDPNYPSYGEHFKSGDEWMYEKSPRLLDRLGLA